MFKNKSQAHVGGPGGGCGIPRCAGLYCLVSDQIIFLRPIIRRCNWQVWPADVGVQHKESMVISFPDNH